MSWRGVGIWVKDKCCRYVPLVVLARGLSFVVDGRFPIYDYSLFLFSVDSS